MRRPSLALLAPGLVVWSLLVLPATVTAQERSASDIDPELPRVRELMVAGRFAEAESLATVVTERVERELPDDAFAIGRALDGLVEARVNAGLISGDETRALARRALAVRATLAPRERFVPTRNLALLAHRLGDFDEALQYAKQAVDLARDHFPPDSRERILSLNILSVVYYALGDGERSMPPMAEAIRLLESQADSNPIEIAMLTQNLGGLQAELGHLDLASRRIERAVALWDEAGVGNHPELARGLNYLGGLHYRRGDYVAARAAYERSVAMREEMLGPEHPELCWDLRGLADVLGALRDFETAEVMYRRTIELRERSTGTDTSYLAYDLRGLGWILFLRGQLEEAHALMERAESLFRSAGVAGYVMVPILRELAICEARMGRFDVARSRLEEALHVWSGSNRALRADLLDAMGYLELQAGDLELARRRFADAMDLARAERGPDHPFVAGVLLGTARANFRSGLRREAFGQALEAESINRRNASLATRWLEEETAVDLATRRSTGRDLALTILLEEDGLDTAVGLDMVIRSRAVVFDELASRASVLHSSGDSTAVALAIELSNLRSRMAHLLVTRDRDSPDRSAEELQTARARKREVERALAERSQRFRSDNERLELGLEQIRSRLEDGDALASFVRFERASRANGTLAASTATYAVFVVTGSPGKVDLIELGPAAVVDSLVARWRSEIRDGERDPTRSPATAMRAYEEAGAALREVVWDPVAQRIGDSKRVFVVPTGTLHFVTLGTLPAPDSGYLIESGPLVHTLSTERDLVRGSARRRGSGLLAVASPRFGEPAGQGANQRRGGDTDCPALEDLRFEPLPASAEEGRTIARLWREVSSEAAEILEAEAATEIDCKRLAEGRRVLHLATHGFFLDPDCVNERSSAVQSVLSANPLLRSGLALVDANQRASSTAGPEDGMMTAEEIVALDLGGTEWAVLSACSTGLGSVAAEEGVFGLGRAFLLAGANSVIMSLWPVEDVATRDWMIELYRQRFEHGAQTAQAVRNAGLAILQRRRTGGQSTHPYHWGAFVAVGDWR